MKRVKTMILFSNGAIAAFDEAGEQIPELQQRSAIELFAEYASAAGWDVEGCEFRTQLPGGGGPCGKIVQTFDGFEERWN